MKSVRYDTTYEMANDVHSHLKTKNKRYTLRPRIIPPVRNCMWWIVPSTNTPSYRYGKYVFVERENGKRIATGIHIEKGLKYNEDNRELNIDSDWVWHEFFTSVKEGTLESELREIITKNLNWIDNIDIELIIDIKNNDSIKIIYSDGMFINKESKEIYKLDQLSEVLNSKKVKDWFWVDFYILFVFDKNSNNKYIFDGNDIMKLLEPLEKWIR